MTGEDRRDFREFYRVDDALAAGVNSLQHHLTARGAASSAMKGQTMHGGHHVHRIRDRNDITFGRPETFLKSGMIPDWEILDYEDKAGLIRFLEQAQLIISAGSKDVLLLSAGEETSFESRKPILALRYGIYDNEFVIAYAQTPSEVTLDDYLIVRGDLGVRPHEFLFAQFIARVAPVLDKYPKTGVYVASHYLDKPVYPTLRDRFFDTHYVLNPNRQRVQEILGEDNAWLEEGSIALRMKRDNIVRKARKIRSGFGRPHVLWPELFV